MIFTIGDVIFESDLELTLENSKKDLYKNNEHSDDFKELLVKLINSLQETVPKNLLKV